MLKEMKKHKISLICLAGYMKIISKKFIQRIDKPNPKTFIGSGKLLEIQVYCKKNDITKKIRNRLKGFINSLI